MNNNTVKRTILFTTFALVIITGIIFGQPFIRMLPLIISIIIMMFQSEANRYAYIAGGVNAVLYAYVYFRLGLYASAASALFFSFPIQVLTFLNWNKHSYKKSTQFKSLSDKARIYIAVGLIVGWLAVLKVLQLVGSEYAILDNTASMLGILVSVLTMRAYIEYSYLWIVSTAMSVILNIQVAVNNISHITYVIYSCYSMWCVCMAFINVRKLYKQQTENK